jgi:DNA-binding transcriptional MocR family regulator
MQSWLPDLSSNTRPKYLAIAEALARDIEAGQLKPGARLPPQRVLAEQLSIDLTTVTKAYNEVRRRGLIEGGGRRGSFVTDDPGKEAEPIAVPLDTGMNLPPEPVEGTLAERYRTGIHDLLSAPEATARFRYQPRGGAQPDRAAAAAQLRTLGVDASEDVLVLTSGGQNALHAVVSSALAPGDAVCATRFAYPGFLTIARHYGLRVVAVASDDEGLDPQSLDEACNAGQVRAVYVVPTNDNPTTATMSDERRREIAQVADRHGLAIIEDDAYGQLPAVPLPPIAAYAPELTWHIASMSKVLSPALRVAWLRAPSVKQAWRLATDVHATTIMAPPLNAALVTAWLRDGSFAALIREVREEAAERQKLVADILRDLPYAAHPEGYHFWLPLPPSASVAEIVNALRPAGLSVVPSEAFAVDPADTWRALRVSVGGGLSREQLRRTLRMLDALLDQGVRRKSPLV